VFVIGFSAISLGEWCFVQAVFSTVQSRKQAGLVPSDLQQVNVGLSVSLGLATYRDEWKSFAHFGMRIDCLPLHFPSVSSFDNEMQFGTYQQCSSC
jgi:hypothetical protein